MSDKLLIEAIEETLNLKKAIKWLENARQVAEMARPAVIMGLDDPAYLDYEDYERERRGRIHNAKAEIERAIYALQAIEVELVQVIPPRIWVVTEYQDRLFGVALISQRLKTRTDYALNIHLFPANGDLSNAPSLYSPCRNHRLTKFWEYAYFKVLH